MKKINMFILMLVISRILISADQVLESNSLILQASSLPEIKLGYTKNYVFPFLQGENPLTEGNNINLALTVEISPVSLGGIAEAVWTPIAFLEITAGGKIGTGWNVESIDAYGIGFNRQSDPGKALGDPFDGLLWKLHAGAALQMDFAAIFPGDWNHILFRSYHEINHRGYSRAKNHEAWFIESDAGENINGFNYYGNLLIGYQMPIMLDLVALLAEANLYLYDTPGRKVWGDDKIQWTFSAVMNFTINKAFSAAVITQFITERNYKQKNWEDLYYRDRILDNSNPLRLEFYRVAAILTYKF